MKLTIKKFEELTNTELYAILRCRAEVFGIEQRILYVDPDNIDQDSVHVFFSEGDEIVAYARVIPPGVKYPSASIGRVLTMKPFRHKGLSRQLMKEAISVAFGMSDEIEIEAQAYLQSFYESLGFVAVSDIFILEGLPHISMIKTH